MIVMHNDQALVISQENTCPNNITGVAVSSFKVLSTAGFLSPSNSLLICSPLGSNSTPVDAIVDSKNGIVYIVAKSLYNVFIYALTLSTGKYVPIFGENTTALDPASIALIDGSPYLLLRVGIVNTFDYTFMAAKTGFGHENGQYTSTIAGEGPLYAASTEAGQKTTMSSYATYSSFVKLNLEVPAGFQIAPSTANSQKSIITCGSSIFAVYQSEMMLGVVSFDVNPFKQRASNFLVAAWVENSYSWACLIRKSSQSLIITFRDHNDVVYLVTPDLQISKFAVTSPPSTKMLFINHNKQTDMMITVEDNSGSWSLASRAADTMFSDTTCGSLICKWNSYSQAAQAGIICGFICGIFVVTFLIYYFVIRKVDRKPRFKDTFSSPRPSSMLYLFRKLIALWERCPFICAAANVPITQAY